jgi:hypothetical protein
MKSRVPAAVISAVFVLGLGACASDRAKAEARKAKAERGEYVEYYPTGSNVPIRVRKDQAKTSESETAQAQEAMRRAQQQGSRAVPDGR